jgi:hypothetical protein
VQFSVEADGRRHRVLFTSTGKLRVGGWFYDFIVRWLVMRGHEWKFRRLTLDLACMDRMREAGLEARDCRDALDP